jgi:hypothetical protein
MLYNSQRRTYRNAAYPSKGGTTTVTATHNQLLVGERWFNGLTALPVVITPGLDKFDDSTVTSDKEWKSPARMLGRLSGVPDIGCISLRPETSLSYLIRLGTVSHRS